MFLDNITVQEGRVNGTLCTVRDVADNMITLAANHTEFLLNLARIVRTVPHTSYSREQYDCMLLFPEYEGQRTSILCSQRIAR